MVHCSVKTDTVQTDPEEFCLLEYMFNQLPAESQLSTLSKLFSVYLSQFSLTVLTIFWTMLLVQCNDYQMVVEPMYYIILLRGWARYGLIRVTRVFRLNKRI